MDKMILDTISMDLIDPNPNNSDIFSLSNIEHLASIIKEEGFTTPIEVIKKENGRYEIISGHRRYEAMKSLGRTKIPCYIADDDEISTLKDRKLLSSNIATRKLTPLEIAKAIAFYRKILKEEKFKGDTRRKIGEFFGISDSKVYRYECILKLIPELQELCKNPNFPYSSLRLAATLTRKEQKELYEELLKLETDSNAEIDEVSDAAEIDKGEIIYSRTRVERIINSKIRKNAKASSTGNMPEPVSDEEDDTDMPPIEDLIILDNTEDTTIINVDDILSNDRSIEDTTYFYGLDSCIATIKAYRKSSAKISDTNRSEAKSKLNELRKEIDRLEKRLG